LKWILRFITTNERADPTSEPALLTNII